MISLQQYYNRIDKLEQPSNLVGVEEIANWWNQQFTELKAELSEKDLAELNKRNAKWQDKVNSSFGL